MCCSWSGEGHDSTRPEVYSGQLSSRSSHCNFNINSNVPDQSSLHSFSIEDTDSSASMVTASDDVTEGSLNSEQQAGSHSNASASSQTDDKGVYRYYVTCVLFTCNMWYDM